MNPAPKSSEEPDSTKLTVRTRTPRPDELSRECFEFISAVDEYKRRHLRSFLNNEEVLGIILALGYSAPEAEEEQAAPSVEQLEEFADARNRYRIEQGRLFPTWSELFDLLLQLGYTREESEEQEEHDQAA